MKTQISCDRYYRDILNKKKSLKSLYTYFYKMVFSMLLQHGKSLEIGSGSGFLNQHIDNLVTSDILKLPWINIRLRADKIPFKNDTFDNIILIQVLHHLGNVSQCIKEVSRVLKKGGRVIVIDHQVGLLSSLFLKVFHHENFNLNQVLKDNENIYFANNTALANEIIVKDRSIWNQNKLFLKDVKFHTLFSYLLTGGFYKFNLLPDFLINFVHRFDKVFVEGSRNLALLMTAVFEKK